MTGKTPARAPKERRSDQHNERSAPVLRGSTLVVTNLTKLVAIGIAVNEMVIRHSARESVIGFCALCLIGTQAAEEIFIHAIDRIFGRSDQ